MDRRWKEMRRETERIYSSHSPPYGEELSPSVLSSILTRKVHTASPSLALTLAFGAAPIPFVVGLVGFQN